MTIKVFVADDHAIVREGLEHILNAKNDIEVIGQAQDGQSAIHDVIETLPDVAILDISMPPPSGIEAARRIQEACPDTQIVILSMHSSKEHVSRALKAGARGYVLKECAGSEVVDAVRTLHQGHSYLSQCASDAMVEGIYNEKQEPLSSLSDRQREVFHMVVEGLSSADIAERLALSPKTIETYRSRIHGKLGTDDLADMIKFAVRHGFITVE